MKVAILDDYQNVSMILGNFEKLKKDFELMKDTAFLINTSRGAIVNEFDLVEALDKNIIMGTGLDVYDIEPLPENHKLSFLPNALLLPHLGYVTKENYEVFYT
jgi:D-3-phosphoglycerate dehydrogenase